MKRCMLILTGLFVLTSAQAVAAMPIAHLDAAPVSDDVTMVHGHHWGWYRGHHHGWYHGRGHHYGWYHGRHRGWHRW